MDASVGGANTVNGLVPEVPPEVVTLTFCAPRVAVPESVNVAVIEVVLAITTLDTAIP